MEIPCLGRKPDQIDWRSLNQLTSQRVRLGAIITGQLDDPLKLLDEEVEAKTFDTLKHRIYSIHFGDKPLVGEDLITLLKHARPLGDEAYRRLGQTRYGILDDWQILDDIGRNRWLVLIHQLALGSDWTEFDIYHRNKMKEALASPTVRETKGGITRMAEDRVYQKYQKRQLFSGWSVDVIW